MKITPETIKEITKQLPCEKELTVGEIQAITKAAGGSNFELICHAYALGFTRGSQATNEVRA